MIIQEQNESSSLPIVIIGSYHAAEHFSANFLQGEVIGHSFFEWDIGYWFAPTSRVTSFMKTLGINYAMANEAQTKAAKEEYARNMPAYPKSGCVERFDDIIVIKLSEGS
jgi:uncharacterized membrane protein